MELELEMGTIAVAATVVIMTMMCTKIFLKYFSNSIRNQGATLPPGSLGLPFMGETLQFLWALRCNRPQDFIEQRVKKFGPVFKTSILGQDTVILASPPGNRLLLSNENKLVVSSWSLPFLQLIGDDALINKFGDHHKCLRVALTRVFCPETLQLVTEKMSRVIQGHLNQNWKNREDHVIKVFPAIKKLMFSVFCELFFNIQDRQLETQLLEACEGIALGLVSVPIEFLPGTSYRRAKNARSRMEIILLNIIQQKRRSAAIDDGGNLDLGSSKCDLLSNLLCVKDETGERLSDKEILDNICFVLQAGFETTTATLTMMLKLLSENQASYKEIVKEQMQIRSSKADGEQVTWKDTKKMKYTWQVLQETLRMFPPIYGTFRRAIVDIEYCGYTIPKGWKLLWSVYSTHVNEAYFADPSEFKPSRFDKEMAVKSMPAYTYLPFGTGVRTCPGEEYAKMEIMLFTYHFVEAFMGFSAVDPQEKISINPFPTPANGFPIRLVPRASSP